MSLLDYTYIFDSVVELNTRVSMIDHKSQDEHELWLDVKDFLLLYRLRKEFPTVAADFVDLAVAVYVADRLSRFSGDQIGKIHCVLPLRNGEIFSRSDAKNYLVEVLYWYTGHHWSFEFVERVKGPRRSERTQTGLMQTSRKSEVALWSGGLDSFAGMYVRLSQMPEKDYILFGTGSDKSIIGCQRQLYRRVKAIKIGSTRLSQIPFHLRGIKHIPKKQ